MPRFFVQIAYDGTPWHGWQVQPNAPTVQAEMSRCLTLLLGHEINPVGCGRTDTGVHARDFYLHFDSDNPLCFQANHLLHRLNRMVPRSVVVHNLWQVNPEANCRFDAIARTYSYYCLTAKDPFREQYAWRLTHQPDVHSMNEAAQHLLNFTDFTSFSKLHTQTATNNCRIGYARWTQEEHQLVFTIRADRFLRNMVRAIVGTLLEVGYNKLSVSDFCSIIEKRDRQQAGMSVPAHGLFLEKVEYPEDLLI
ncbi:MAG: tRNA pseudouridine(38-40) synthase TruA [Bacteroidales bacterium]|nr:tRNA pseudouridine(38-40) synthase TruA [Bacteroidales bacterium]MDD3665231.1 tRNA pseudouridine(38-40) synthase TruA [Bacteroidales bacterium]